MRTVILHYHLFKNAGTSLDRILQKNFGDRWVTREFGEGRDNSEAVTAWIRNTPEAVAFSTHTALGPVPVIEDTRIVTVMLLRDPLERIRSAYRFERTQEADTWGANLAKEFPFSGYVRARLAHPQDRQCRNFQTWRLASMVPGEAPVLERAKQAAEAMGVLGLVDRFDAALEKLAAELAGNFPEFTWESVRANVTGKARETDRFMVEPPQLTERLREANADDLALMDWLAAKG
jgi:hypothetical protein